MQTNYGQQYGGQYQQQYLARQMQPMWACVPVTCREEAVAVPMDYRYAGILMPDEAHNAVYAKVFDSNTGATRFCDFAAVPPPKQVQPDEFVTRKDFADLCAIVKQLQDAQMPKTEDEQ